MLVHVGGRPALVQQHRPQQSGVGVPQRAPGDARSGDRGVMQVSLNQEPRDPVQAAGDGPLLLRAGRPPQIHRVGIHIVADSHRSEDGLRLYEFG